MLPVRQSLTDLSVLVLLDSLVTPTLIALPSSLLSVSMMQTVDQEVFVSLENVSMPVARMIPVPSLMPALIVDAKIPVQSLVPVEGMLCVDQKIIDPFVLVLQSLKEMQELSVKELKLSSLLPVFLIISVPSD